MRTPLIVTVAAMLVGLVSIAPAGAEGDAGAKKVGDVVDFWVSDPEGTPGHPGTGGGGPVLQCTSRVYVVDDNELGGMRWDPVRQVVLPPYANVTRFFSSTGRWLIETCAWSDNPGVNVSLRTYPEGQAVDPLDLMRQATGRLDPPDPTIFTAPPRSSDLLVQTPTWLWIEPSYWRPYTETASTGRVSATATATPVRVTWDMGNGESIVCTDPGTAWSAGLDSSRSTCNYTYKHSSAAQPGHSFDLSATVTFEVIWTSVNAGGAGGSLRPLTRTATVPVTVGEVQALVVAD